MDGAELIRRGEQEDEEGESRKFFCQAAAGCPADTIHRPLSGSLTLADLSGHCEIDCRRCMSCEGERVGGVMTGQRWNEQENWSQTPWKMRLKDLSLVLSSHSAGPPEEGFDVTLRS